MVPSESAPQELSNEWSCQYVSKILIFFIFCVLPLVTKSPSVGNELKAYIHTKLVWLANILKPFTGNHAAHDGIDLSLSDQWWLAEYQTRNESMIWQCATNLFSGRF
jgi:hypothetical protein